MNADAPPAGPIQRRQRIALIVAVACAVVSTVGLVASTLVKSPQEQRATAGAPTPSVLSAAVERRVLESVVVSRGTVAAATKMEVTPVAEGAKAQVVTRVAVGVGDEVKAGQVLLAVSGRPLVVLAGPLPAYRDLKPGITGDDVNQLQDALTGLELYGGGDSAGYFGDATKRAVEKLYASIGYDVAAAGEDQAATTAAQDAVDAAQQQVAAMQRRIAADEQAGATEEPLGSQLTRLRTVLRRAQQTRDDLVSHTGPMVPLAEFVFVPDLPGRVTALSAKVGEKVVAPLVTIAAGKLSVVVRARPDQAETLRPDMAVKLVSETLGQAADAKVTTIGGLTTSAEGGSEPFRPVTVTPVEPLPAAWSGLDVRVTITSSRTDAEVLVVPLSAVSAGADGRTTVSVLGDSDKVTRVEVRPGISGAGFVEIAPVNGGLDAGDRVVVSAPPP